MLSTGLWFIRWIVLSTFLTTGARSSGYWKEPLVIPWTKWGKKALCASCMPNIFSAKNVLVLNHIFGLLLNCGCIVCAAFMSDSLNQATRRSKWVLKEPEGKGVEVPSPSANFACQISHLPASFLPSPQPIFLFCQSSQSQCLKSYFPSEKINNENYG